MQISIANATQRSLLLSTSRTPFLTFSDVCSSVCHPTRNIEISGIRIISDLNVLLVVLYKVYCMYKNGCSLKESVSLSIFL